MSSLFRFLFLFTFVGTASASSLIGSDFKLTYVLENHYKFAGGIHEANVVNGLAIGEYSKDFDGTQVYLSVMAYHGKSPVKQVGDIQWTSNIDTNGNESIKIYEVFLNQDIFSPDFRFRAGLLDLALTYNINEPALLFNHSSPGTSAEWGLSGPHGAAVYPWPSIGADIQFDAVDGHYIYTAAVNEFAGNKKSARYSQDPKLDLGKLFYLVEAGRAADNWKAAFGLWKYTSKMENFDSKKSDQAGWYVTADHKFKKIYHPYIRYGQMNSELTNAIHSNLSAGITIKEPFGIEKDVWGLMFSTAFLSKYYVKNHDLPQDHETAYEAIYRHHINPFFDGSFSYMFVDGPAGHFSNATKTIKDAHLISLRLIFKL